MTIDKSYYYSAEEWSRSFGYGEVPPERLKPMEQLELFPEIAVPTDESFTYTWTGAPSPWVVVKNNIE